MWQVQGPAQPSWLNSPTWDVLLFIGFWNVDKNECCNCEEKDPLTMCWGNDGLREPPMGFKPWHACDLSPLRHNIFLVTGWQQHLFQRVVLRCEWDKACLWRVELPRYSSCLINAVAIIIDFIIIARTLWPENLPCLTFCHLWVSDSSFDSQEICHLGWEPKQIFLLY